MILYLVRHGQTDFNKSHRMQGQQFDEPLNESGRKEIESLLPDIPKDIDVIFSSPLKRALMSAEIISKYLGKPIVIKNDLKEYDVGSFSGKTWDEIENGQALRLLNRTLRYDYRPQGGESVEDVTRRVQRFLDEIKREHYSSVLAVAHGGVLRLAHKIIHEQEVAMEMQIHNASIHKFEI